MVGKEFGSRKDSAAFAGGQFGDEGKGRLVDERVNFYAQVKEVVVCRNNGGANAGHTIELPDGQRIALHQLPSGVFTENATLVLGKGMVIHPGDLCEEIHQVEEFSGGPIRAEIWIDQKALLSLDTHRAYEAALKEFNGAGKGATGRGISPAYADYYLRQPLRVRDLVTFDIEKLTQHYRLYERLFQALIGINLSRFAVSTLGKEGNVPVGSLDEFLSHLSKQRDFLMPYSRNVIELLREKWQDKGIAFVFEQAQGIGLDPWYGVYPDVTASRTGFDGIFDSTEGVVDPKEIQYRAGVIKATYMSSVGTRRLPTMMEEALADRIRNDNLEFGATTGRKRDIVHLDLEAMRFFAKAGGLNCLVLTHLDSVYSEVPIKVCIEYRDKLTGKRAYYTPDQTALDQVRPVYLEFDPWSKEAVQKARTLTELPKEAKDFLSFISEQVDLPIWMVTTGPRREQGIVFENIKRG